MTTPTTSTPHGADVAPAHASPESAGPESGEESAVQGPAGEGPAGEGPGEVAALRVRAQQRLDEAARVAKTGDRLSLALWAVAAMALMFTMANVTTFAVEHDTPWWIGWLLDPMASLALLVVLIGDGVLARHGQRSGGWARLLKHGSALATWSMNAWTSVAAQDLAGIVLHSVPPALVIGLSEATPTYRAKFAELAERLQGEAADLLARADALQAQQAQQPLPQPTPAQSPVPAAGARDAAVDRTSDRAVDAESGAQASDRTPARTPGRTLSEESGEESGPRTLDRTHARTLGEGSGRRTPDRTPVGASDRTPVQGSGGRRSEGELLGLVRAAIAEGRLPARPSGTAIQRELGGGKGPAMRVAAALAAPEGAAGDVQDDAPVIHLVHDRAEAAS